MSRLETAARRHGADLLIVLVAAATALDVALRHDALRAPRSAGWFAVPAAAAIVLVLLLRHRFPWGAPAGMWVLGAALSVLDGRLVTFTAGATVAGLASAFLLGQLRDPVRARSGLAIVVAGSCLIVLNDPNHATGDVLFVAVPFVVAWLAGFALRERGDVAAAAEERARQAERARETAAALAVAEERARIARELHDVVAHAVSVIVLQVGAVRHGLPPERAADAEALRGVEGTGRAALAEMRRLLGALRREDEALELGPQPGLDRLEPLLAEVRRAGLAVELRVDGEPVALPGTLDLSAYRVVQEGLTNALKHAHATRAEVTVRYGDGTVGVDVRDDGRGAAPDDGGGYGLVGVRERVKLLGGELTAGAADGGGFRLAARFPLDGALA